MSETTKIILTYYHLNFIIPFNIYNNINILLEKENNHDEININHVDELEMMTFNITKEEYDCIEPFITSIEQLLLNNNIICSFVNN
jgi:hypothetical protein